MCGGGATSGLGGIFKTIKKIDPLQGGDKILDKLGLPSVMGEKHGIFSTDDSLDTAINTTTNTTQASNVATDVQAARDTEKRRRAAAAGLSSTILGGSTAGTITSNKTLLGS